MEKSSSFGSGLNLLAFDYGLTTIDHDEQSVVEEQQKVELPSQLNLLPSEKLVDPYSNTALDFRGDLAQKVLSALEPKIDNERMYLSDYFAASMCAAYENLKEIAGVEGNNGNILKAIHVLVDEMALQELLHTSLNSLVAV